MRNKFERIWFILNIILLIVFGIGGSIYMLVYGLMSDDRVLNILTWILIILVGPLFLYPMFLNISEWLKKKKILNKNQAHWFSLIPITPFLVGQIIGVILFIIGILSLL
tara:strand:- start:101 stop:427 length:327 start_codon:yes stop_codon:yes gene_type:complete